MGLVQPYFSIKSLVLRLILFGAALSIFLPVHVQAQLPTPESHDVPQAQVHSAAPMEAASEPFSFESSSPPSPPASGSTSSVEPAQQTPVAPPSSAPVVPGSPTTSTQETAPSASIDTSTPIAPATAPTATSPQEPPALPSPSGAVDAQFLTSALSQGATLLDQSQPSSESQPTAGTEVQPTIHITMESPLPGQLLNESDVRVNLRVETTESQGLHFHVFLDNQEPLRIEDLNEPIVFHKLDEGAHVIRVLAINDEARAFPDSFTATRFFVKKKNFKNMIAPSQPYLTLNLPTSGSLPVTKESKVYLEFFVHNASMGADGNVRVRYTLDGKSTILTEPDPVVLEKLIEGQHRLKVELIDASENTLLGPFNCIERTFEILRVLSPLSPGKAHQAIPDDDVPEQ